MAPDSGRYHLFTVLTTTLAAAALLATPRALIAQNALVNPDFAQGAGFTGWSLYSYSAFEQHPCDSASSCGGFHVVPVSCCGGTPANGIEVLGQISLGFQSLSQCVTGLTPGADYLFGAWVMRTPQPRVSGVPKVKVLWYSSADCSAQALASSELETMSSTWTLLQGHTSGPSNAQSAKYVLWVDGAGLSHFPPTYTFAAPHLLSAEAVATVPGLSRGSTFLFALVIAVAGLALHFGKPQ